MVDSEHFEVSLIIPVYNAAKYVEDCVRSASKLAEVKEILLIEDFSNDDSHLICEKIKQYDPKVKLFYNTQNLGAGASRNVGLQHATCEFISFLDADDLLKSNRFVSTKKLFKNKNVDGVYERFDVFFENESSKNIYLEKKHPLYYMINEHTEPDRLFSTLVINKSGYFILNGLTMRRTALLNSQIKFDETLRQMQDTDFLFFVSRKLVLVSGDLKNNVGIVRIHETNRILNKLEEKKESERLFYLKWLSILLKDKSKSEERSVVIHVFKNYIASLTTGYNNKFIHAIKLYWHAAKFILHKPILLFKIIKW